MRGHLLCELATTAVAEVLSNASRTKRVIANSSPNASTQGLPSDHPIHVGLGEGIGRQNPRLTSRAAKQVALEIVRDAGGLDVGIQIGLEMVIAGHLMPLAVFEVN
jgi:hypothetical protein